MAPGSARAERAQRSTDPRPEVLSSDGDGARTKGRAEILSSDDKSGGTKGRVEVLSSRDDGTSTQEKEERAPADWAHFAPAPAIPPSRMIRLGTRAGGFVGHEWTLAILGGLALAAVLNWAALSDPRHSLPRDLADPSLFAYLIAWTGHALGSDPANLWHVNAFFPAPLGLAYADPMLGYAPLGLLGTGEEAAALRYNLILVGGHALAFVGAYALARQLGLARVGGVLVAVAVAAAPWRLGDAGHLYVVSGGASLLALAMLARAHGVRWRGRPGPRRPEWALPGWLLAAWQVTVGFGIGLIAGYAIAAAFLVGFVQWVVRHRGRLATVGSAAYGARWLIVADALGVVLFAGAAAFVTRGYQQVARLYPDADPVSAHSAPWRGLLTAPERSLVWGSAHSGARDRLAAPAEMALLPGYALAALALAGLVFSVWALWVRLALLAGAAGTAALALGAHGPGRAYVWLADRVPGLGFERVPGRLVLWTTLFLGLLAAGGLVALVNRAKEVAQRDGLPGPTAEAYLALLLPIALVLVEGLGAPAYRPVPPVPAAVSAAAGPYLVLPTDGRDADVMLWSTAGFADVVNGDGPLLPTELTRTRERVRTFPDAASVDYLRGLGVRTVILLPDRAKGTPWERAAQAPVEGLGIRREDRPGAVVFRLG